MEFLLLIMTSLLQPVESDVKHERISRTATIRLNAQVDVTFQLFGPIKEKEWAYGWDPEIIYSATNLVEQHMIFRTKGRNEGESSYIWTITTYDTSQHIIEYTVSTANRVWFITVVCSERKKQTVAAITYTFTNLTNEGREFNTTALNRMYAEDLKDWERAINYYLKTGKVLIEH
jgi:hypothetical protein